jgi:hypothetical protein
MGLEFIGYIKHYPVNGSINFYFQRVDPKASEKNGVDVIQDFDLDLDFEIWQKYKDKKIKITVDTTE